MNNDSFMFWFSTAIWLFVGICLYLNWDLNASQILEIIRLGEQQCVNHGGLQSFDLLKGYECKNGVEINMLGIDQKTDISRIE